MYLFVILGITPLCPVGHLPPRVEMRCVEMLRLSISTLGGRCHEVTEGGCEQ